MLDAPGVGPGRAADRGVACGCSPTDVDDEVGPPGQPDPRPVQRGARTARRAACRCPGCPSSSRPERVVAEGQNMYGDPVVIEGTRAACRARCSTRPTTSTGSCSSTGWTARPRKAGEGGHPRGRVVRRARPGREGQPAPAVRTRALARCGCVFAGTPEAALPQPARLCWTARGTRSSPFSPARTPRPAAGRKLGASPGQASSPLEAELEVLTPAAPARAGVPASGWRRSPRTAARWWPTVRCCRGPRSTSPRRAG